MWACLLLGAATLAASSPGIQSEPPYPPSPVIQGVNWDFEHLIRLANTPGQGGSDLWPTTWAPDGNIYTGWGDGGGFSGASDYRGRVSLGFGRIIGNPPSIKGVDVWGNYPKYAQHPATFCGKPVSMLSVGGVLYAWVSSWFNESNANFVHCAANPNPVEHRLAWSPDLGATWTLSSWKLDQLRSPLVWACFLNFGADNAPAEDRYVYQYWRIQGETSNAYLVRTLPEKLQGGPSTSCSYEYYAGPGPVWSAEFSKAQPVFVDASGRCITHVAYDVGLRRFIASVQGHSVGQTGLFDAPQPWGPWTTIAYYQDWGGYGDRESLGIDFPTKWISRDGKTLWAVFSGGRLGKNDDLLDSFNLVKLTLLLRNKVNNKADRTER